MLKRRRRAVAPTKSLTISLRKNSTQCFKTYAGLILDQSQKIQTPKNGVHTVVGSYWRNLALSRKIKCRKAESSHYVLDSIGYSLYR